MPSSLNTSSPKPSAGLELQLNSRRCQVRPQAGAPQPQIKHPPFLIL